MLKTNQIFPCGGILKMVDEQKYSGLIDCDHVSHIAMAHLLFFHAGKPKTN